MVRDQPVAGGHDLVEIVPGVDVHHRERQSGRREGLDRQVQHDDRVLAAGEQQYRPFELGGHLADDVDRLGLERAQVAQLVLPRHRTLKELLGHAVWIPCWLN